MPLRPLKQLRIAKSDLHERFELTWQIEEGSPIRRVLISKSELAALMCSCDRLLAREPRS
jgi:hypothetical protein